MAHPMMGMLNAQLGERVIGYGRMGERVVGYGSGPAQMGFSFSDIINQIGIAANQGLNKAKNDAIASTLQTIVKDPQVQTAIVESGNDAAIQSLAQQLKSAQTATITYVQKNPYTTLIMVGGAVVGVLVLMKMMRK